MTKKSISTSRSTVHCYPACIEPAAFLPRVVTAYGHFAHHRHAHLPSARAEGPE